MEPQPDPPSVEPGTLCSAPSSPPLCLPSPDFFPADAASALPAGASDSSALIVFSVRGNPIELEVGVTPSAIAEIVAQLADYSAFFADDARFPRLDEEALRLQLRQSFSEFDRDQAEARAIAAAADFVCPNDMLERDTRAVLAAGSISVVVDDLQRSRKHDRFNEWRVREYLAEDEEYERLLSLARLGSTIYRDLDFVPTTTPEPLRAVVKRMPQVFLKHAHKLWSSSQALVLQMKKLPAHV